MEIVKSIMTNNPCYVAGRKIEVKGLMLHSVGCSQPSANAFIKSWNKITYARACVHAFIDANSGVVYQTLPWNHRGWHCGKSGNNTHIGVEMCEPAEIKYTGGSSFTCSNFEKAREATKKTYESAVALFAFLCKEYDLNPMTDIVSHSEGYKKGISSNHGDPEHLWKGLGLEYTMDTFRKAVKDAMAVKDTKIDSVAEVQAWLNKTYNSGLAVDGQYGKLTKKALVMALQVELGFTGKNVDGIYGNKTASKVKKNVLGKGDKGDLVRVLQALLVCNGYAEAYVDGSFGSGTEKCVKNYQKLSKITIDGLAGNATFKSLCV